LRVGPGVFGTLSQPESLFQNFFAALTSCLMTGGRNGSKENHTAAFLAGSIFNFFLFQKPGVIAFFGKQQPQLAATMLVRSDQISEPGPPTELAGCFQTEAAAIRSLQGAIVCPAAPASLSGRG
jgi:hypothetical protein